MSRPSEPLLRWLRARIDAAGHSPASLADKLGRPRVEVRRILTGAEPMTVDDLVRLGEILEIDAASLGVPDVLPPEPEAGQVVESVQWQNQPRVLLRTAFDGGMDVLFLADVEPLRGVWGGPDDVLAAQTGPELPIRLDAAYHRFMEPSWDDEGFGVKLSFDRLYRCLFPWSAIRRVVFYPYPPEPVARPEAPAPTPKGRPALRLVK